MRILRERNVNYGYARAPFQKVSKDEMNKMIEELKTKGLVQ